MVEQALSFSSELRRRRHEAGRSLADMAKLVHYSKSHLSKVETGIKAASWDLANRCDAVLDADGSLVSLVALPASPQADTPREDTSEELVMSLGRDGHNQIGLVGRRDVLAAGAVAVATWVLAPTSGPSRYDTQMLTSFQSMLQEVRKIGQTVCPAALAPIVVSHWHALQSMAAHAPSAIRDRMLVLSAHFATYAGWMAQESGDDAAAYLWTDRASELATNAGDTEMAAYSFVRRALVSLNQHDALATIALAQRAQSATTSHRVRCLAAQREAQGHAVAGDYRACRLALDRAAALQSERTPDESAPIIGTSTVVDGPAIVTGWCMYDLGRAGQAAEILERELTRIPESARRARARYGARLSLALASMREVEQACITVQPVLDTVVDTGSATIQVDLRRLAHTLNRWHGHAAVRSIQPQLAKALHGPRRIAAS